MDYELLDQYINTFKSICISIELLSLRLRIKVLFFPQGKLTNIMLTTPLGQLFLEVGRTQPTLSGLSTSVPSSRGREDQSMIG